MPERTGLLALVFLAGCGPASGRGVDASASGNPLVVQSHERKLALDAVGMFTQPVPAEKREPLLPELPFLELSDGLPPSGSWSGRPLLADFTSDRRDDLVASNCEEDGYSVWTAPQAPAQRWIHGEEGPPHGWGCGAACAADIDHDGHVDLVLSTSEHGLRVLLGDGGQKWREPHRPLADTPPVGGLATADLDGDGTPDIVGIGYPRGGLVILMGDKVGGLHAARGAPVLAEDDYGRDVELADLDLDGRADIVVATGAGVRVFLTEPTKPPRWREQSQGLPRPACPDSLTAVCVGRFTADPRPQIAVCSEPDASRSLPGHETIGVYAWNAAKGTWERVDSGLPRGDRYSDLRAADFDGDGRLDLIALSLEHGAAIYLGDGQGGFQARGRLVGVHGRGHIAVGYIDQDERPDIVLSVSTERSDPEVGGLRAFLNRPSIWTAR